MLVINKKRPGRKPALLPGETMPDDETICLAAEALRKRKSRLPQDIDGYEELPAGAASWAAIRIERKKRSLQTIEQIIEAYDHQESIRKKYGYPELDAGWVFVDTAKIIRCEKRIPSDFDTVAGRKVRQLNKHFKARTVNGCGRFTIGKERPPNLNDFIVCAGMGYARPVGIDQPGPKIWPASPQEIEVLEKYFNLKPLFG
jgi:hypothetical protein